MSWCCKIQSALIGRQETHQETCTLGCMMRAIDWFLFCQNLPARLRCEFDYMCFVFAYCFIQVYFQRLDLLALTYYCTNTNILLYSVVCRCVCLCACLAGELDRKVKRRRAFSGKTATIMCAISSTERALLQCVFPRPAHGQHVIPNCVSYTHVLFVSVFHYIPKYSCRSISLYCTCVSPKASCR